HGLGLERGGLKRPCELRADDGIAADHQHGAEAEACTALENVAARQCLFFSGGKTVKNGCHSVLLHLLARPEWAGWLSALPGRTPDTLAFIVLLAAPPGP